MTSAPLPPVEQVAPGLWVIPVPIPINPLRYVLVHVLETTQGLVLIDAGWDTPEAWQHLTNGLAVIGARDGDVHGLLVTHIHPDHYGLAGRVREELGAWVALHPADAALLDDRYLQMDALIAETRAWLARAGAPADRIEELAGASLPVRPFVTVAQPDVLLEHDERVPVGGWDLRAVHTPGHSPGHLCFYDHDRKLLFSGDHVLPRISPNVSVHPQSGPDPLGTFLASLERVRNLPAELTLPAHEWRFTGLTDRVDELIGHHEHRLDAVVAIVHDGAETTYEVAEAMPWSRGWHTLPPFMRRLAIGEAHAHLIVLDARAQLTHQPGTPERWSTPGDDSRFTA